MSGKTPQTQAQAQERKELKKCPRCGESFNYLEEKSVSGRIYVYAVHRIECGKKKKRCYLGPKDGYIYVKALHNIEPLTNLQVQDYLELALCSLIKARNLIKDDSPIESLNSKVRALEAELWAIRKRLDKIYEKKLIEKFKNQV